MFYPQPLVDTHTHTHIYIYIYVYINLSSCYNEYTSCRQQLRESSIELRNLEAQLRAAYITKELAAQVAEKEAAKMKEKVRKLNTSCRYRALSFLMFHLNGSRHGQIYGEANEA